MMSYVGNFHDDLRRTPHNLTMVGLVARLQQSAIGFVTELLGNPKPPKSDNPTLIIGTPC